MGGDSLRFWHVGRRDFEQLLTAYKAKHGIADVKVATTADLDALYAMAGQIIKKRALK